MHLIAGLVSDEARCGNRAAISMDGSQGA